MSRDSDPGRATRWQKERQDEGDWVTDAIGHWVLRMTQWRLTVAL
jgi:hypothetical protein